MRPSIAARWEAKFELLVKFVRKYNHASVPTTLDTPEFPKLGTWVSRQRAAHRNERLVASGQAHRVRRGAVRIDPERAARLEEVGLQWVAPKDLTSWKLKLSLLKRFVAEHGHARVPQSLNSAAYPQLGSWVSNQRMAYRNQRLLAMGLKPVSNPRINAWQVTQLEALGFVWGGLDESAWDKKFCLLKKYVAKHGTSQVPQSLDTQEFPRLGQWVSDQRRAYRSEHRRRAGYMPTSNHRLSKAKIAKLESINFEWTTKPVPTAQTSSPTVAAAASTTPSAAPAPANTSTTTVPAPAETNGNGKAQ